MNKNLAYKIVDDYFKSWLKQDKEGFLSLLHEDVVVKECTGDVYKNKMIAEKWFEGWNVDGNKVFRWDISNRYYDNEKETAIIEWEFECLYEYNIYCFLGISTIRFKADLIYKLNEYQMDKEKKYPYL